MGHIFDRDSYLEGIKEKRLLIIDLQVVLDEFSSYILQTGDPYSNLDAIKFVSLLSKIKTILDSHKD